VMGAAPILLALSPWGRRPEPAHLRMPGSESYSLILPTTNPIRLPKPKPRAAGVHFVVPSIYGREVTRVHWSGVRDGEDALQPLDFGNGLFSVHPSHYLTEMREGQFAATSRKTVTEGFVRCQPILLFMSCGFHGFRIILGARMRNHESTVLRCSERVSKAFR
jgi:hypothetical protein